MRPAMHTSARGAPKRGRLWRSGVYTPVAREPKERNTGRNRYGSNELLE